MEAVRGVGAPAVLLDLVEELYGHTESQVRLGQRLTSSFQTKSGVTQDYAQALFCRAMA